MNRTVRALAVKVAVGAIVVGLGGVAGCAGTKAAPAAETRPTGVDPVATASTVVSTDILAREPVANSAVVKHILISWHDLGDAFQGHLDPRAEKRSKADAEAEVRSLVKQLQEGADFDTVMKAHSEDTGSAMSGRTFTVAPDSQLVIEFRQLSLRLRPGEFGVCQSDFGFHIIKRVG
jgi:hypothetical protein